MLATFLASALKRYVRNPGESLSCTRLNCLQFLGNTKVFKLRNLGITKNPRRTAFTTKRRTGKFCGLHNPTISRALGRASRPLGKQG